jgi:alanine dehydrogenase
MHIESSFTPRHDRVLVLSDEVIRRTITLPQTIPLIEAAFAADALGVAVALPVVVKSLDLFDAHLGIKSGYIRLSPPGSSPSTLVNYLSEQIDDVLGLKAGGYWSRNSSEGKPSHSAVLLLLDPGSGNVTALMSANSITWLRTAAAGAIAATHLARSNSEVATVIGAGEQAHAQLAALRLSRRISRAYVWARNPASAAAFASAWRDSGLLVEPVGDICHATEGADIVITATPSLEPLINDEWVHPGTHITAVGSDGKGKQELDVRLLQRAKVVVDKVNQSLEIGELQHAIAGGFSADKMIHAELGEICAGLKPGRESDEEITVFDSSGVSIQDLVVASYLVRRAKSEGLGKHVTL